ncbi:tetratricopeptide repeat protein 5-like [Haliotis rufescens]|uniref:tetratricopeptide repeat protein 5-like n=1 Tax=Haliotis rufescens TaxID=6454 RepID=UPI00201F57DB|nr:tetratricopeptide repeat protein 5-like [Haliotis rufescens]
MAEVSEIYQGDTGNSDRSDQTEEAALTPAMALQKIEAAVNALFEYRDRYFEKFGVEKSHKKADDVKAKLKETLQLISGMKDKINNKAMLNMLQGKALNVTADFDQEALDLLSKAVKLDPKLVEAWNHLGECYWKSGNIPSAKNCFTGALNYQKNKVSLRNLSMVLRQLSGPPAEKVSLIEESVEKAKEAIQLDIKDGTSWLILGNAYLSLFFTAGQNPKVLKQCMSAYAQAERDPVAQGNPDLHFNRATSYQYQEEYQQALAGFDRAMLLDPGWDEPGEKETQLLQFLGTLTDMINTKGKMKGKKLESLVLSMNEEKDLGPYRGGSYTGSKGKSVTLKKVKLSDLQPEINHERVVTGKVVCTISSQEALTFTFCMVDEDQTCFPVNVYNIAKGSGVKIGDSVAIPDPYVQLVKVNHKEKVFEFSSIRVDLPVMLVVNGRKLGLDKQAMSVLSVSAMSE